MLRIKVGFGPNTTICYLASRCQTHRRISFLTASDNNVTGLTDCTQLSCKGHLGKVFSLGRIYNLRLGCLHGSLAFAAFHDTRYACDHL